MEQFYDLFRSNKKDTKISPDVLNALIYSPRGVPNEKLLLKLKAGTARKLYLKNSYIRRFLNDRINRIAPIKNVPYTSVFFRNSKSSMPVFGI
ncbi:hypothetical protein IMSAGC019_01252 [Lachnospiraceae bacterium]|nr:hypothetical protein IMSAGC019_01252 [Lachnospiraceae bacterium]